jgi:hypothetical protein
MIAATAPLYIVVAVIGGLMLAIPITLIVRAWVLAPSSQGRTRKDVCYCNGVAVSLDDLDSRV